MRTIRGPGGLRVYMVVVRDEENGPGLASAVRLSAPRGTPSFRGALRRSKTLLNHHLDVRYSTTDVCSSRTTLRSGSRCVFY